MQIDFEKVRVKGEIIEKSMKRFGIERRIVSWLINLCFIKGKYIRVIMDFFISIRIVD